MDGIIILDKPEDFTSFDMVAKMRRLLGTRKVGHAGTLDPMATGVLPIFVGRATKCCDILPNQNKRYTATFQLGYTTDTLDATGRVLTRTEVSATKEDVEKALESFRGEIMQLPPMYSAIQINGKRLYDLARQGIEVERQARSATIYSLDIVDYDPEKGDLTIDCLCSRGTYIRTLCHDLGQMLGGVGGVMTALRRTMAAGYTLDRCITLDEARELTEKGRLAEKVLPVESAFEACASVQVSAAQAARFANGGALSLDRLRQPVPGTVRVYAPDGRFLGLGRPSDGELKIVKLF